MKQLSQLLYDNASYELVTLYRFLVDGRLFDARELGPQGPNDGFAVGEEKHPPFRRKQDTGNRVWSERWRCLCPLPDDDSKS